MKYIGIISTIMPLVFLYIIRGTSFNQIIPLAYISSFWLASDLVATLMGMSGENTNPLFNVFDVVSTLLFLKLYLTMFSSEKIKVSIKVIALVYFVLVVSLYTFYSGWMTINPLCSVVTGTIPIVISVGYFYRLLATADVKSLYSFHLFWINSAVLIYFGLGFLVNVYSYILAWNGNLSLMLWPILMVSSVLFNSILTIGIWKMKQK